MAGAMLRVYCTSRRPPTLVLSELVVRMTQMSCVKTEPRHHLGVHVQTRYTRLVHMWQMHRVCKRGGPLCDYDSSCFTASATPSLNCLATSPGAFAMPVSHTKQTQRIQPSKQTTQKRRCPSTNPHGKSHQQRMQHLQATASTNGGAGNICAHGLWSRSSGDFKVLHGYG